MKRILIITYYWPPGSGSGVQRWLKFSKYLPGFGYKPVIYTPENTSLQSLDSELKKDIHPDTEVIRTPIWEPVNALRKLGFKMKGDQGVFDSGKKNWLNKLLAYIRVNMFIPDPRKFWVRPSVKYLKSYLQKNPVDFVVTTGPPHSMHLIALSLKKQNPKLKWIADFRDPWASFDFLRDFKSSSRSLKKQRRLEHSVLNYADRVLATSYQMPKLLEPFDESKFKTITNGFDQDDFSSFVSAKDETQISIFHGGVCSQYRNPYQFWKALNELCAQNKELDTMLKIHFVGLLHPAVKKEIESFEHLKEKLIIESFKPHSEIVKDYSKSDVLLLLVNNSDNAPSAIPGKLFEYMATSKPIIMFGPEDCDASTIVKNYNCLRFEYDQPLDSSEKNILQFLLESKSEPSNSSKEYAMKFERKSLTAELVKVLEEL